jgi:hypothetical protein
MVRGGGKYWILAFAGMTRFIVSGDDVAGNGLLKEWRVEHRVRGKAIETDKRRYVHG